jgi:uncharacterized Rmd1/YagE family protein
MQKLLFQDQTIVRAHAIFIGERLNLKLLENTETLAPAPLVVPVGEQGCAVLFRYGSVVLFGLQPVEEAAFLTQLQPLIVDPFPTAETEETNLRLDVSSTGRVEPDSIWVPEFSVEHVQIVAVILAKSVVLAHYENSTAKIFDRIEPFAAKLQRTAKDERLSKELLTQIGTNLWIQNKIVGRVEIVDKPEMLWDAPHLERLFLRLEDEYEIRERHLALERKLELISRTAETALDLLQHNTTLRVEWYIVLLIVFEIILSLYDLFLRPA